MGRASSKEGLKLFLLSYRRDKPSLSLYVSLVQQLAFEPSQTWDPQDFYMMIWHSCLAALWFSINEIKFHQMTTRLETWSQGPLQIFSLGRILWLKNMICPQEICGLRICCAYGISIPFFPSIIKRNRNEKTFQLKTKASVFIYSIKQIQILSFSI